MMYGTLALLASSVDGQLTGKDAPFRGVSTDTRTLAEGELFVALKGPNFDGTRFVHAAAAAGASSAVVSEPVDIDLPQLVVPDTYEALGKMAGDWRRQMPATVVGITGSNGKTTLKEMLASCLMQSAETLATQGNLNNEIGVPLMLTRLGKEHRFAVIEMGANHAGEIAYLASLARPKIVAITNAAPAHLEGFGSLEGVAHAKGEILTGVLRPDTAILNADDEFFSYWSSLVPDIKVISFGLSSQADFRASDVYATEYGSTFTLHFGSNTLQVSLPLHGAHNVLHACAAAAIASALDIDEAQIKNGLEMVQPVAGCNRCRAHPVTPCTTTVTTRIPSVSSRRRNSSQRTPAITGSYSATWQSSETTQQRCTRRSAPS